MKLLEKHILRELVGPFLFGVAAFSSVFFAGTYLLKLTNWVMNGMPLLTAIEIVLLYLPGIIVYTLPMSTLLSVLLGIGRLSSDSEITALFAGGISLYRIAVPVVVMGILISGSALLLNELISPWAYEKSQNMQAVMLKQATTEQKAFMVFDEGSQSLIRVNGGIDVKSGMLKDVSVIRYKDNRPILLIYAAKAHWTGLTDPKFKYRWNFYDGYSQSLGDQFSATTSFGDTNIKEIEIKKTPGEMSLYQKIDAVKDTDQLSFAQLSKMVEYLRANPDKDPQRIRQIETDRWNRFAVPLSSLIFALLAAPMGIRPQRSSSSVGLGISIFIIFIYWMVWHYTTSLSIQGNIPPFAGAFLADGLGIIASIILLRKAAK